MGIDIERVDVKKEKTLMQYFSESEKKSLLQICESRCRSMTVGWTIKESISKAIKTGFTVPMELFEIKSVAAEASYFKAEFVHFSVYQSLIFFIEDFVCSITYPRNITLLIDVDLLKNRVTQLLHHSHSI
nr:4'-phosphopantetheinyl transferase superfamily protein [Paenibacillus shirakamiensis]